ncbi:MAG TPA: YcfL family protein [Burkholderiaceae bacterium]|nr:YcfL family protein [Burkholderiaceae bacterium]
MTIFIRQIAVACSIALAGVTAQAQTQPGTPAAASGGIASRLIVRGDLQGLQVVDLRSQRRNDMLVVQAEMINAESKDLRLYYRFRWLDAGGMQVGDGEVWKPLVFMGKQSQFLKGTGYGPQATDFRIEMSSEPR